MVHRLEKGGGLEGDGDAQNIKIYLFIQTLNGSPVLPLRPSDK